MTDATGTSSEGQPTPADEIEQALKDAAALKLLAETELKCTFVSLFLAPTRGISDGRHYWQIFDLTMFQLTRVYDDSVLGEGDTVEQAVNDALTKLEEHTQMIREVCRSNGVDIDKLVAERTKEWVAKSGNN